MIDTVARQILCFKQPHRSIRRTGGFSLIEVLVAMIILGIGLLGLAALQAQSLKFNHDAYVRTQSTTFGYDIMERMRLAGLNCAPYYDTTGAAPDFPTTAAACTMVNAQAVIAAQVAAWRAMLAQQLPPPTAGAAGTIVQDAATETQFTVAISWYDRDSDTNLAQQWVVVVE